MLSMTIFVNFPCIPVYIEFCAGIINQKQAVWQQCARGANERSFCCFALEETVAEDGTVCDR